MLNIECVKTIQSSVDDVTKFIFKYPVKGEDLLIEATYVDNQKGKNIICLPSQTGCKLGCKFCYLTKKEDQTVKNIDAGTYQSIIDYITYAKFKSTNESNVISFMGSGEPLLNTIEILRLRSTSLSIRNFSFASIVPIGTEEFLKECIVYGFKFYYSLHHPNEEKRSLLIPCKTVSPQRVIKLATDNYSSYLRISEFRKEFKVHYTLFEENNSLETADELLTLFENLNVYYNSNRDQCLPTIRFLKYQSFDFIDSQTEDNNKAFIAKIRQNYPYVEEYTPPGADINAACGMFELDTNILNNEKRPTNELLQVRN